MQLRSVSCIRVLESSKKEKHSSKFAGGISSVAISSKGDVGLSGGYGAAMQVWDMVRGQHIRDLEYEGGFAIFCVDITPDGRFGLASIGGAVALWDIVAGRLIGVIKMPTIYENRNCDPNILTAVMTPEGNQCLYGTWDEIYGPVVLLSDFTTGECLKVMEGHKDMITSVDLSPDGRIGLSGSRDNTIRLWDLNNEKCVGIFQGHTEAVTSVSLSPTGLVGISGSTDKTVRLWNLISHECLAILEGHTQPITSIGLSPDIVVSASHDKTLRVWNLMESRRPYILSGHTDSVTSVAVTPDSRYILSGSLDKTVRLWGLDWD